jgi:hypothetical protein
MQRLKEGASWSDAITGIGADYGQSWRDNTPFGNILWGTSSAKMSAFNPLEESTSRALNNMKPMASASSGIVNQGFTRSKGAPVIVNNQGDIPADPIMRQMYQTIGTVYSHLTPLTAQINDTKKQMQVIKDSGYANAQKRDLTNQLTVKLNQQWEAVNGRVQALNLQLSHMAGGRHVDVAQKINWQGNVSQFYE